MGKELYRARLCAFWQGIPRNRDLAPGRSPASLWREVEDGWGRCQAGPDVSERGERRRVPALLPGLARLRGPRRQKEGRGNQAGAAHCWAKPEGEKGRGRAGPSGQNADGESFSLFFCFVLFLFLFISKPFQKQI